MKEESMVGGKQNYPLYTDVAGVSRCSLYQGASGLSGPKTFVILWEMHSYCPGGMGGNCQFFHRAKHRPPWDIEHLEAEHRFLWAKWLPERKRWGSLSCPLKIRQVSLSLEEEEEYHARSAPLTWEKLQERGRSIPPSSHTPHSNNVWRVRFMGKEAWDTMGTWAYLGLQWKWDLSWRVRGSMGERFWGARWETFRACWLQPKLGDRMESDTALLWAVTKISECVVRQSQVNQGELEMFGEFRIEQWHNRICVSRGRSFWL